jgi:DNA ligase-1
MSLFVELARLAEELAGEGSKLQKRAAIAKAIRKVAEESAAEAGRFCLYLAGLPFAEADARKLNAGGAILSRAVKEVSGASDAALTAAYRRHGDLGAAAVDLLEDREQETEIRDRGGLRLEDVAEAFDVMAKARTTAARAGAIEGLLRRASALEAKYLLKLMLGDMRIGVKQSLVEEAIAVASGTEVAAVRHAVMLEADLSRAVERAFAGTLGEARMRLFHPLGFMLASPVETPEEAVERFTAKPAKTEVRAAKVSKRKKRKLAEEPVDVLASDSAEEGFAKDVEVEAAALSVNGSNGAPASIHAFLEDKYDGIRAQVHCGDPEQPGRVAIYSRNREDVTASFPDLEEAFLNVREASGGLGGLIFDGEILGWDVAAEKALPFSILGQRIGRKRVDNAMRRAIPVVFMAFDLLYADGELLLPLPLRQRRTRLEAVVERLAPAVVSPLELDGSVATGQSELFAGAAESEELIGRLRLSAAKLVESAEAIDQAYGDARARANEGVMIKAAGSAYLPGRRGLAWVKLKRELATLDVVITGAEFGHGRRAGLLSDYTFAVRGQRGRDGTAELLNVGKAYSGVTDSEIAELTEWLKAHTVEDFGHFRTVEPLRVLEVAFNNIMRSDRHSSGFALRFPRILRVRDDKPVEEIDTLERVEDIYQSQPDKGGA